MDAPDSLGAAGSALWMSVAGKYALRPDEFARLDGACRTADMIERLETVWFEAGMPMVSRGSMGQEVIHPLIGELRAQRAALDGALVRLKLPDDGAVADPSTAARKAASARWSHGA